MKKHFALRLLLAFALLVCVAFAQSAKASAFHRGRRRALTERL